MVVWVATDSLEKRVLEFDWYQVSRKILVVGRDSGRYHVPDQRKDFASVEISLVDSYGSCLGTKVCNPVALKDPCWSSFCLNGGGGALV